MNEPTKPIVDPLKEAAEPVLKPVADTVNETAKPVLKPVEETVDPTVQPGAETQPTGQPEPVVPAQSVGPGLDQPMGQAVEPPLGQRSNR